MTPLILFYVYWRLLLAKSKDKQEAGDTGFKHGVTVGGITVEAFNLFLLGVAVYIWWKFFRKGRKVSGAVVINEYIGKVK